jgi:hypothetical protein
MDLWEKLGEIAFNVLEQREEERIAKAAGGGGSGLTDDGDTPGAERRPRAKIKGKGPAGIFTDPDLELHNASRGGDYAERPTGIDLDVLRRMARTPPIAAVGNVMCDGLAEFCTAQVERSLPGQEMRMRGKDRRYSPTKAERAEMERMQRFVTHCGYYEDEAELVNRPDLESVVRSTFWDSFRFDSMCWQIEPTAAWKLGGRFEPFRFYPWPAHTIRLAMPPRDGTRLPDDDLTSPRYVQVDKHDNVVASFTGQQMMFGVMHPLTDIENAGYGYSVLEQLLDVLAAWLYGYGYNKAYFKQGANVRGVLHFETEPPKEQQRRFERYFHALIAGVGNAHKVPIAWGGKAQWLGLGANNREMEFSQWLDFLNKLLCAICGIDPVEMNFVYGNSGQTASIGGQQNATDKIQASRARWLRPRVRAMFKWINRWIVAPLRPEMELVPTGIDEKSEQAERERLTSMVKTTHTVDEVRAMMGDKPMPNGDGKVILDSTWLQFKQAKDAPPDGAGGDAAAVPPEAADDAAEKLLGGKGSVGHDEQDDTAGSDGAEETPPASAGRRGAGKPGRGSDLFDTSLIKGERASHASAARDTRWTATINL